MLYIYIIVLIKTRNVYKSMMQRTRNEFLLDAANQNRKTLEARIRILE